MSSLMESSGHLWLLTVTGFIWAVVVCQGPENNCYFDPAAITEGDHTKLTCRFPVNVKENRKNFFIQISNDSVFTADESMAVNCVWTTHGPSPDCTMLEGYTNLTTDDFTVTADIPNSKKEQAGHYKCFVVNPDAQSTPKSCYVSVVDRNRSDSEPSSETTIVSEEVKIGLAVGGCVSVAILAILIYCCLKSRNSNRPNVQRGRREAPQEEVVMLQEGSVRARIQECENRDKDVREGFQPRHV